MDKNFFLNLNSFIFFLFSLTYCGSSSSTPFNIFLLSKSNFIYFNSLSFKNPLRILIISCSFNSVGIPIIFSAVLFRLMILSLLCLSLISFLNLACSFLSIILFCISPSGFLIKFILEIFKFVFEVSPFKKGGSSSLNSIFKSFSGLFIS